MGNNGGAEAKRAIGTKYVRGNFMDNVSVVFSKLQVVSYTKNISSAFIVLGERQKSQWETS